MQTTNAHNRMDQNLERDAFLRSALECLEPAREVMPFSKAIGLIDSAPPARIPWYARLVAAAPRQLKYAMAPMLVMLMAVATLWAMPAQSDNVGTVLMTQLPANWNIGGAELAQLRTGADEVLAQAAVPQSEVYILIGERGGRDSLAFVLLGLDEAQARAFHTGLSGRYPALAGFTPAYQGVDSGVYGESKLSELYVRLTRAGELGSRGSDDLRAYVLGALYDAGLSDIEIDINRLPDGRVVINVDAAMDIAVEGRTQEELAAAGINPATIGEQAYSELLTELAAGQ